MKVGNRQVIILAALAALILGLVGFLVGQRNPNAALMKAALTQAQGVIEQQYREELLRKEEEIALKNKQLKAVQSRYDSVMKRIKEKAREAENIQPPAGCDDVRTRLNNLGYPVK